ncbi:hypothetical protein LZ30DRAFT_463162 [Colletotrichum cereale]|nr:hypothetical protein LZ30DRAFT_463162 [Colletotrichum cereale]
MALGSNQSRDRSALATRARRVYERSDAIDQQTSRQALQRDKSRTATRSYQESWHSGAMPEMCQWMRGPRRARSKPQVSWRENRGNCNASVVGASARTLINGFVPPSTGDKAAAQWFRRSPKLTLTAGAQNRIGRDHGRTVGKPIQTLDRRVEAIGRGADSSFRSCGYRRAGSSLCTRGEGGGFATLGAVGGRPSRLVSFAWKTKRGDCE